MKPFGLGHQKRSTSAPRGETLSEYARTAALLSFGSLGKVKSPYRETKGPAVMDTLVREIRYGG